ncbi:MAG TPA: O-antigen ligase family protein [Dehalococcoidia bacterium]
MTQDATPRFAGVAAPAEDAALRPAIRVASSMRFLFHAAYFGFAVAALIALCLFVPAQTSRAPEIVVVGFAAWAIALAARLTSNRGDGAAVSIEPAQLFVPALICTYTVFAFEASPDITRFTPSSPDSLPGLHINQHAYFGFVLVALAAFAGWYGTRPGRLIETLLAVQIVLISVMYERFLSAPTAVPPLVIAGCGLLLLRLYPIDGETRPIEPAAAWVAGPLGLFVVAAFVAAIFGAYAAAGLAVAGEMLGLAMIAVVLFDCVREDRQRWLVWAAIVAPAIVEAVLVDYKLLDIARHMGASYAFGNRIELAAGVEPNPLGLSLAIGVLMIAGALPRIRDPWWRSGALAGIAVLIPALVVTYSVGSLLGLGCGLVALAVLELGRVGASRRERLFALGALAAIGVVVAAAYIAPTATRDGLRYTVDDPTTGRSRVQLWDWALRDFRDSPITGSGPGIYWPRAQVVPEFPYRDVTQMLERRRLLGQDSSQWRFLFSTHPHNLVIDIAEGMGIIGLIALAAGMAAAAWASWRVVRERRREDRWFGGLGVAMAVAVIAWSMGSVGVQIVLLPLPAWVALAIVGTGHRGRSGAELRLPDWVSSSAARAFGFAALAVVMIVFVVRPIASNAWMKESSDRSQSGDRDGAAAALRIAAAIDPLDANVRLQLANYELQRGNVAGSAARMLEVNARLSDNGAMLTRAGEVAWLRGDTEGAERYFRRAIDNDSWQALNGDPYTPLGLLLLSRGDRAGAIETIAEGMRVSPINARDPAWVRTSDGASMVIDAAYAPGADANALQEALRRRMFLPSGTGRQGDLSLSEALRPLEDEARATVPNDPTLAAEIFDSAALAYQFAGFHSEAVRVLGVAATVDPDASYVRYDLAQSHIAIGDDLAATGDLEATVELAHRSGTYDLRIGFAERDLALIAMRAGGYEAATRLMRSAVNDYRWAYLPLAYPTLAEAYERLGQPEEAERWRRRESFLEQH